MKKESSHAHRLRITCVEIVLSLELADPHVALAPDRLPPHAYPARRVQPREEFGEVAFVLGFTGEAADRVHLAGAAAAPLYLFPGKLAAAHSDGGGALSHGSKIDVQRSLAPQSAQRTDAIAESAE